MVSYSASKLGMRATARPGLVVAALLIAVAFSGPFVYLLVGNASDLGAFWSVVSSERALLPLTRSVTLASAVSLAAAFVGTGAAWFVARTDVALRPLWRVILPLPLVFPSFIGAMVMLAAFAPGGLLEALLAPLGVERMPQVDGFVGSFVVLTLFTYPYVYLPVTARLRQLPASVEESARLLGRSPRRTFFSVVLPQIRSAVLAGALLVFLYVVSEFGVVQLMRYDTLTRMIYSTRLLDRPTSLAAGLLLGVVALVTIASERALIGPRGTGERRSARPLRLSLGRARAVATGGLALLVAFAFATPVGVLLWWSVRGVLRGSTAIGDLPSDLVDLAPAITSTAGVGAAAAIAAVVLVVPAAYLTVRRPGRIADVTNAVVVGGFALPGLAIALAIVSFTIDAPGPLARLYQTLPLLVFAYVVHFGAQAMRTAQVAIASVPQQMEEAGRVLGASRIVRLFRIEVPLMMPGLLAGGGLVLLSTMKELPATLLLAPIGFETLAVKIWSASESALFAQASLASLVLVATSGLLTWWLVIKRSDAFV